MNRQRDLLPWVLGGLSTAAVVVAFTAVSTQHAAIPAARSVAVAATAADAPALPSAPTAPTASLAHAPALAAVPIAPPVAPAWSIAVTDDGTQAEARTGQIWACTTKGVKTFSNNPCGENSTLLEVGPINTMNPTMPVHYVRAYPAQLQYTPPYSDTGAQPYAEDDSEQDAYENGANSYTIVQGVAVLPRRRPEHHHPHRPPYHHNPASAPRKF